MAKRYEQKSKPTYLTTSTEMFQGKPGDGCCNLDSPCPIGENVAAILKKPGGSSSQSKVVPALWPFPLADESEKMRLEENGMYGVTVIDTPPDLAH